MLRLILLTLLCGGVSAGSHSHRYYYTSMTPIAGLPEFVAVGYVDELELDYYDSDLRKMIPRQRWMEQNEGPEYWERNTQIQQGWEQWGKANIPILKDRTNQTGGIHTLQVMYGCERRDDGTTKGFFQFGWDGKDVINFDKDQMVWVTPVPWGEITKDKWDRDTAENQRWKGYLEGTCIEWLEKYLKYGESQLKTVAPAVSLNRLGNSNKLSCVATGFYPQAIKVEMQRDGSKVEEIHSTGARPNHDGTYQIQNLMDFEPKDQAKFSCVVDQGVLNEKMVVFYEPKADLMIPIIVGVVIAVLLIALAIVAFVFYKKKAGQKTGYNPAKTSDKGDSSSASSANA